MSGSNDSLGVWGAVTTTTGIAVLPKTSGNTLTEIAIYVMIVCGASLVVSFIVTRIVCKAAASKNGK